MCNILWLQIASIGNDVGVTFVVQFVKSFANYDRVMLLLTSVSQILVKETKKNKIKYCELVDHDNITNE